jgi:D-alanyl-D-alanine carboxypeptidase
MHAILKTRIAAAFLAGVFVACCGSATAAAPSVPLRAALQADLQQYLAARGKAEHISAASLSISLHGQSSTIDAVAGTTTYGGSVPVTPASLFQIGSNTKAFTAALILQLEAEKKLTINQTVGQWVPQYPQWANVTIRQLLDMTSGITTYDDSQKWQTDFARAPTQFMTAAQLIAYVDPNAPLKRGWIYSNTGYLLAELIIEKATGNSYATEIQNRLIAGLGLHSTFYNGNIYPAGIQDQMVSGYFDSRDPSNAGLAPILQHDVKTYSMSWAASAGGVVSNPTDMTRWVRALYQGPMLAPAQRAELMTLVSTETGMPIADVTPRDAKGFGLGVARLMQPAVGKFWFYEGETLGYRMVHMYVPQTDAAIAIGVNSQPNAAQDKIAQLTVSVYKTLKAYGQL